MDRNSLNSSCEVVCAQPEGVARSGEIRAAGPPHQKVLMRRASHTVLDESRAFDSIDNFAIVETTG